MDMLSKEIVLLDDFHAMVKIHWRAAFTRKKVQAASNLM